MATISTAGYGDVTGNTRSSPEVIYSILILIVGMLVYSVGESSRFSCHRPNGRPCFPVSDHTTTP